MIGTLIRGHLLMLRHRAVAAGWVERLGVVALLALPLVFDILIARAIFQDPEFLIDLLGRTGFAGLDRMATGLGALTFAVALAVSVVEELRNTLGGGEEVMLRQLPVTARDFFVWRTLTIVVRLGVTGLLMLPLGAVYLFWIAHRFGLMAAPPLALLLLILGTGWALLVAFVTIMVSAVLAQILTRVQPQVALILAIIATVAVGAAVHLDVRERATALSTRLPGPLAYVVALSDSRLAQGLRLTPLVTLPSVLDGLDDGDGWHMVRQAMLAALGLLIIGWLAERSVATLVWNDLNTLRERRLEVMGLVPSLTNRDWLPSCHGASRAALIDDLLFLRRRLALPAILLVVPSVVGAILLPREGLERLGLLDNPAWLLMSHASVLSIVISDLCLLEVAEKPAMLPLMRQLPIDLADWLRRKGRHVAIAAASVLTSAWLVWLVMLPDRWVELLVAGLFIPAVASTLPGLQAGVVYRVLAAIEWPREGSGAGSVPMVATAAGFLSMFTWLITSMLACQHLGAPAAAAVVTLWAIVACWVHRWGRVAFSRHIRST